MVNKYEDEKAKNSGAKEATKSKLNDNERGWKLSIKRKRAREEEKKKKREKVKKDKKRERRSFRFWVVLERSKRTITLTLSRYHTIKPILELSVSNQIPHSTGHATSH
jgi:hypothetical protein